MCFLCGIGGLAGLGVTDQECCDQVGGGGRAGSIVCCNGRVIPCAWHGEEKDPETLALKIRATLVHEGVHARDSRSQCKGAGQDGYAGVPELEASECRAYAAELPWLRRGYDECTSDHCRNEFDRQIRFTTALQPGGVGNWMPDFCRKAGMQIPAVANEKLVYDKRDPSIPQSTAKIFSKCPEGWSTTELDGKPVCYNKATGEFAELGERVQKSYGSSAAVKVSQAQVQAQVSPEVYTGTPLIFPIQSDPVSQPVQPSYVMRTDLVPRDESGVPLSSPFAKQPFSLLRPDSGMNYLAGDLGAVQKKAKKPVNKVPGRAKKNIPQFTGSKSSMSSGQMAAAIGIPVALAAASFAKTRSPMISLAAGIVGYFATRAVQSYMVRPGTMGPRIPGTNQNIVNY